MLLAIDRSNSSGLENSSCAVSAQPCSISQGRDSEHQGAGQTLVTRNFNYLAYGPHGRLLQRNGPDSQDTWELYDELGRPKNIFRNGVNVAYTYDVPAGLISSFPVRTVQSGGRQIVPGLELDGFLRAKLDASIAELEQEKALVADLLG